MCTCWRSEVGVNRVIAAAPPAQLNAPAWLQAVQLRKALAPRRIALWHARDRPRRIQHLLTPHEALARLLDTHDPVNHARGGHGHQGMIVPAQDNMMSLQHAVLLIYALCKWQQQSHGAAK